jgi:hypothetical protein
LLKHHDFEQNTVVRTNKPTDRGAVGWHIDRNPSLPKPRTTILAGVTNDINAPTFFADIGAAAKDIPAKYKNLIRPEFIPRKQRELDNNKGKHYVCFPDLSELEHNPSIDTMNNIAQSSGLSQKQVIEIAKVWGDIMKNRTLSCTVPAGGFVAFPNCGTVFHRAEQGQPLQERGPDEVVRRAIQTKERAV